MRAKWVAVVRYLLPALLVSVAIGAGVKLGTLGSHRGVGASENYAVPIGEAGPPPAMCGSYSGGLDPLCLHGTVCAPGQFIGGIDGGTFGCAVPTGDGGSVPGFTAGGDHYGSNSAQYHNGLVGDASLDAFPIAPSAAHFDYAADAAIILSQEPTTAAQGAPAIIATQLSTNGDGGGGPLEIIVPAPNGAGAQAPVGVYLGDAGSPVFVVVATGPTSAAVCLAGMGASTICNTSNALLWTDRNNGLVSFQATSGDSNSQLDFSVNGTESAYFKGASWDIYAPQIQFDPGTVNPSIGITHTTVAATTTFTLYGQDAKDSSFPNGGDAMLAGGASYSNGVTGLPGRSGLCLGGGDRFNSEPNNCRNDIGVDLYAPIVGVEGVGLGQMGNGMTSSNSVTSGKGWTWFAEATAAPSTAPTKGTQCWSDPTSHALTCWVAGAGSPFVVGGGGGGGCSIAGDVTGACGSNVVTTITGNGSGVVAVVANNFAYAGGGLLQLTSNGSGYFGAAGAMTVASTGGAALFEGATAELGAVALATVQGGSVAITSTGSTITETAATSETVNTGTTYTVLANSNIDLFAQAYANLIGVTSVAAFSTTGSALFQGATSATLQAGTGAATVQSSSSSIYVNAQSSSQLLHEQVGGVDQLVLDNTGVPRFPSQSVTGFAAGSTLVPKPGGYMKVNVAGTIFQVMLFPNGT